MEQALALIFSVASASLAADGLYATSRSVYSRATWHISPAAEESSPTATASKTALLRNRMSGSANGMRGLFREAIKLCHECVIFISPSWSQ